MSRALRRVTRLDIVAVGLILVIGALQFAFCRIGSAFYGGDTTYFELARSIIERRSYGFDFRTETMLPPGFPFLLALVQRVIGDSHLQAERLMVVATTFAFLVAYALLRQMSGRRVAAGICVLLAASPLFFRFASTTVFSDMPYFLTSMLALWTVNRLDQMRSPRRPFGLICLAAAFVAASVLVRTSGIALVVGACAWIAATFWFDRVRGTPRLKTFSAIVLCGLIAQLAWTLWAMPRRSSEWPIGGYPKPYLEQLTVKNGNEPERGPASLADIGVRVVENVENRAAALDYLVTGKGTFPKHWFFPWIFVPIGLVVFGLIRSIRRSGGSLAEWYFIAHEAMYLMWPWDFEDRFFLPVAPLACLYAWRGAEGCLTLVRHKWHWPDAKVRYAIPTSCVVVLCALVANGLVRQVDVARQNREFNLSRTSNYADVVAAEWVHWHVPQGAVVMARQWDVAYHYSDRKVVWFPPTTDPDLLLDGILKYHVDFVIVVRRGDESYWKPDDDRCFRSIAARYPRLFAVVQAGNRERIYAVQRGDLRHRNSPDT